MAPKRSVKNKVGTKMVTAAQVRAMIRSSEELSMYTATASGNTAIAGAVTSMTGPIVQGDDTTNRRGEVICVKSIEFRFACAINAVATTDRVRLIIFCDTQNQNAVPNVSDVISVSSVQSPYSIANKVANRFSIMYDSVIQLNVSGSAGANRVFVVKPNRKVFYSGNTGNWKNAFFYLIISDTPTNVATYALGYTIRFTDS